MRTLPVIDLEPLLAGPGAAAVAERIGAACREDGFFYVRGHGVPPALIDRLDHLAREFFAWPDDRKAALSMALGGRAWRGWFPVNGELTSGRPDLKEGLYFGEELGADDPRVRARTPLHGANLVPEIAGFRAVLMDYQAHMTRLGHALMRGVALSLHLPGDHFSAGAMREPLTLFRIFHYPPQAQGEAGQWGVGEHTDYGVLTIRRQDATGGLQVHSDGGWIEAPPIDGTFVVNIGDMLERLTGGLYVSTPHRVRNAGATGRISMPFFFDPGFFSEVRPIAGLPRPPAGTARRARWDGASVHDGLPRTYGEYLLGKVGRVFPALRSEVLP
jgi:isopenicillin N synthase-like dioxygenase